MLPASAIILVLVLFGSALPFRWARILNHLTFMSAFPVGMYWIAPAILIAAMVGLLGTMDRPTRLIVALLTVFAMALASRVMFKVLREGYSIFYNPPLFIVFTIAVTAVIWFGARHLTRGDRLRLVNCFMVMNAIWFLLVPYLKPIYQTVPVTTPIGTIFTQPPDAVVVPQMVSFVRAQAAAGKRVLILPEFPMLYVMGGTDSPSRWYEMVPGMLDGADEKQLIADAESQHVEYVIITNRTTFEYGYPYFGIDWCKDIYSWINSNFEQSSEFGKFERSINAPFAALVYKRRTIPGAKQPRVLNQ